MSVKKTLIYNAVYTVSIVITNIITLNVNTVIFLKGGKKIYTIWLCSCSPGRFFDQLKNLSRHFVHTKLFNIFVLFTLDCRTVIITWFVNPCSYLFAISLPFSSWVTTHPCNHAFPIQKFSQSQSSHLAVQIFAHIGQKTWPNSSVQMFEQQGVQIFVQLAWIPCEQNT